jgi:hypothetical protein
VIRSLGRIIQFVFALAVLLGLVVGVGWLVYTSIDKAPGVVAAVVASLSAVCGLFVQRFLEQQREEERHRRERMAPTYEQLVETFYRGTSRGHANDEELQEFFTQLAQRLLIWGKPEILRAWNHWRAGVADLEEGSPLSLLTFEQFIYAMRADLGHDDKELHAQGVGRTARHQGAVPYPGSAAQSLA